ncbi:MAG: hypothetical protein ACREVJ_12885, partial [Gammaproteobacteria bacterium]
GGVALDPDRIFAPTYFCQLSLHELAQHAESRRYLLNLVDVADVNVFPPALVRFAESEVTRRT